jgi:hypothetical protein
MDQKGNYFIFEIKKAKAKIHQQLANCQYFRASRSNNVPLIFRKAQDESLKPTYFL